MPYCTVCKVNVEKRKWIGHLRSNLHKTNELVIDTNDGVHIIHSAFQSRIVTYRIVVPEGEELYSTSLFFMNIKNKVKSLLDQSLQKHTCIKVNFEFYANFIMMSNDNQDIKSFATQNIPLHFNYDFNKYFSEIENILIKKMESFQQRDSGWSFLNNCHIDININKYEALSGSKYIALPKLIKNKKACLNIRNNDEYCFLWCVMAALNPTKTHPERVSSYPHFQNVLNTKNMNFPISFADISTFEKNNPNIAIFVYGLKDNKIEGPLYRSESDGINHINLLLIENENSSHYCLIKNLSRLVRSQITKHHGNIFFCDVCFTFFRSQEELNNHVCGEPTYFLPEKGSFVQFKNYEKKQDVPYVIYADFETMLQPVHGCDPNPNTATTTDLHHHIPIAFAYNIICTIDETQNLFVSYRGEDCVSKFVQSLQNHCTKINEMLNTTKPMIFTEADSENFQNATRCHICKHLLWNDKVRDHCHISAQYRGAAHAHCNLQYKLSKFVPIFFHNLSGYDCHLFIKELGEIPGKIQLIPKTKENYISFTKFLPVGDGDHIRLRFADSLKFLGTSLGKLAKTLTQDDFHCLKKHFPAEKDFCLLTRKGVYPYNYMTSWETYLEDSLPSKSNFYNVLTNEDISTEDYEHAQSVWNQFRIQTMGDYTDLYLKTDVLILSDIFEKFRKTCKQHYQLDPAHFITAPQLSFDAMMIHTGVKLELLNDLSMIRMIQSGIRGGIVMCSHRYVKANHKFVLDYDPSQQDSHIVYIDCNNLYGHSMCQSLPESNFRFLNQCEIDKLDVSLVDDDADYGYILEVDLAYPHHLHGEHDDLPFCPEKCIPPGGKTKKLIPNLYDKYNYVIHYRHLKTCLDHGLLLQKIHRVITFKQSPYLKSYIELNTKLRQEAKSVFEQDFFKLLNNSVFGKTLENNESRVTVHLVKQWNDTNNKTKKKLQANRLIANPRFHSVSIFSENLVAIQMKPKKIVYDKPIYIGFTVLELSKTHMYNFHYNIVKPYYQDRVKMCYTDTDSFIYAIKSNDFYQDLKTHFIKYFDTSNYNIQNEYGLPLINKKVPGLFKDEMGGRIITEFVGLRSKMYCIKTQDRVIKKAKGVKSSVMRDLTHLDYKSVLLENNVIRRRNILFRSIRHQLFTRSINKVALSHNDDKKMIRGDKISTTAWGSKYIF